MIAHEVGHHIQTIPGISERVQSARKRVSKVEGNQLQVRMELQADCWQASGPVRRSENITGLKKETWKKV